MPDSTDRREEAQEQDQANNTLEDSTSWDNWPVARELPPNPNIKLILHGLLLIAHRSDGMCEIGIHNDNTDHDLSITVYDGIWSEENPTAEKIYEFKLDNPSSAASLQFELNVTPPGSREGVFFYQRGEDFDRSDNEQVDSPEDFRWIPDLENHEFYNRDLSKLPSMTRPRFIINNGIFYTKIRTLSKFLRFAPGNDLFLGHIALIIAANVYVDAGTTPELIIASSRVPLLPGKNYQIEIFNDCERDNCGYRPDHPRPDRRNDFHQYLKTFVRELGDAEFQLKCHPPSDCRDIVWRKDDIGTFGPINANDAAPCGAIGHGKSDGLN